MTMQFEHNNSNHHHRKQQQQRPHNRAWKRNNNSHRKRYRNRNRQVSEQNDIAVNKKEKLSCSICTVGKPNYKCPKCRAIYCCIACCRKHKEEFCEKQQQQQQQQEYECNDTNIKKNSKYLSESEIFKLEQEQQRITDNETNSNNNSNNNIHFEDEDVEWKITDDMKNAIEQSDWLRSELNNDIGLQLLIRKIVITSSNKLPIHNNRRGGGSSSISNIDYVPLLQTEQEQVLEELKNNNQQFQTFIDKLLALTGIIERPNNAPVTEEWLQNYQPQQLFIGDETENLTLKPLPSRRNNNQNQITNNNNNNNTDYSGDSEESTDDEDDDSSSDDEDLSSTEDTSNSNDESGEISSSDGEE